MYTLGNICIGTPCQNFSVAFITGFDNIALPNGQCKGSGCSKNLIDFISIANRCFNLNYIGQFHYYTANKSSSFVSLPGNNSQLNIENIYYSQYNLNYNGYNSQERIILGDYVLNNKTFVQITQFSFSNSATTIPPFDVSN